MSATAEMQWRTPTATVAGSDACHVYAAAISNNRVLPVASSVEDWVTPPSSSLLFQRRKQVGVDLLRIRSALAVRKSRIDLQLRVLHQFGRKEACVRKGHNLIVIATQNQGRDINLLHLFFAYRSKPVIIAKVLKREW